MPYPERMRPRETAAVMARSLRKVYGSLTAVDGINFEVREGEFFGVLGANGAGKSTTMRMVYQVSPVTSGELWVLGMRAGRESRALWSAFWAPSPL